MLHGRVGEALARRAVTDTFVVARAAAHLRLAGRDDEAATFFEAAGDRARSLYANGQALEHYRAGLALGHPAPERLHEAVGDLLVLAGDYPGALESFETAAALRGDGGLGRLEHKLGMVFARRGEWPRADSHFVAALDQLDDADDGSRARVVADRSLVADRMGASTEALRLAREALEQARRGEDTEALAQAHNLLGILASARVELGEARRHLRASVHLAESLGDTRALVAALNNLGLSARRTGDLAEALSLTERALELCSVHGDRHHEAALHNNMADVLHAAGRQDDAMAHLKKAVAIFAEIGQRDDPRPEIWKLVEW